MSLKRLGFAGMLLVASFALGACAYKETKTTEWDSTTQEHADGTRIVEKNTTTTTTSNKPGAARNAMGGTH